MKNKILVALTAVFVLGLAMAVYAFNKTNDSGVTATASCCAKKDACPLKNKGTQAATAENHSTESCCGNADCCCKSGACPMKASGEKAADCCGNCCGGSCPMKSKQTETADSRTKEENCPHKTAGS